MNCGFFRKWTDKLADVNHKSYISLLLQTAFEIGYWIMEQGQPNLAGQTTYTGTRCFVAWWSGVQHVMFIWTSMYWLSSEGLKICTGFSTVSEWLIIKLLLTSLTLLNFPVDNFFLYRINSFSRSLIVIYNKLHFYIQNN